MTAAKPFLLVLHQAGSDPGRIGRAIAARGYPLQRCCPAVGDALPATLDDLSGVVIFGGPMSANDDHMRFIRDELRFIEDVVLPSGKPFLGVCLGGQMLARVLGGSVEKHCAGKVEIGFHPICATDAGRPWFPPEMTVYQWHREGIGLPPGPVALAHSCDFENQAFRVAPGVFGIQFHTELTTAMMNRWLMRGRPDTTVPGTQDRATQIALRVRHDPAIRDWLTGFVARWIPAPQP